MSAKSIRRIAHLLVIALKKHGVEVSHGAMLHAMAAAGGGTNWHVLLDRDRKGLSKQGTALRSADLRYLADLVQVEADRDEESQHLPGEQPQGLLQRLGQVTPAPVDLLESLRAVTASLKGWMDIADEEDQRDYDAQALKRAEALLEGQPTVPVDALDSLLTAARRVVSRWEHGDLAEAVRELDATIGEIESMQAALSSTESEGASTAPAEAAATKTGRWSGATSHLKGEGPLAARVRSDDEEVSAAFDASGYFAAADEAALKRIIASGFLSSTALDEVAYWYETRYAPVGRVLAYVKAANEAGRQLGFSVELDRVAAEAWIRAHRPALLPPEIDRERLQEYVGAHGFGEATAEGLELGARLIQQGDDYATAAHEVVARGLTEDLKDQDD